MTEQLRSTVAPKAPAETVRLFMPNLTFYISAPMPSEADLAQLSADCMQLCTGCWQRSSRTSM
jgi:hypothetical protein